MESIAQRFRMTTNATQAQNATVSFGGQPDAANGLALVRVTIGAMFVWVFFENLGKGLYTPAGYAGLINYYIKASHSPAAWKAVMGLAANHAGIAAPMQGMTELSLGILLVIGLLTRPAAIVAFLFLGSLWISEWGTSWIWELLVPVLASLGLALGRAGRRCAHRNQQFPDPRGAPLRNPKATEKQKSHKCCRSGKQTDDKQDTERELSHALHGSSHRGVVCRQAHHRLPGSRGVTRLDVVIDQTRVTRRCVEAFPQILKKDPHEHCPNCHADQRQPICGGQLLGGT